MALKQALNVERGNRKLHKAKVAKNDEFYTQFEDIQKELVYYQEHFKGKIVYCNCDDPFESNFVKYFILKFNELKLKRLIATSYKGSPVANTELSLFDYEPEDNKTTGGPYKIDISEVSEEVRCLDDVKDFLAEDNRVTRLKESGDFRSDESRKLLEQADIVVTNPPFSLFREYIAQLIEYDKKFVVIGNVNAITYKEIFPLIKENKLWLGYSIHSGDREFNVPHYYPLEAAGCRVDECGRKYIRVKGVRWVTNLIHKKRHEEMILYRNYTPENYPKYDNYEAINIDKTADIPCDYDGIMGVPITFLDKYNPNQFEILGLASSAGYDEKIVGIPFIGEKDARPLIHNKNTYARIFIRRKK